MRKTPIPANITFAGENTWDLNVRGHILDREALRIYQANTFAEGCRKCIQNSNSGIEPLFRAPTIALRLNELLNIVLAVKYIEDSARGVAMFQLGCELMCKKVLLRLPFIVVQGSIENILKIGRGG
jgi:hypothetical protein